MKRAEDIVGRYELSIGAIVDRTAFDCEVCVARNEEPSKSEFVITYEDQRLEICAAHMQEVLNSEEDGKENFVRKHFEVQ